MDKYIVTRASLKNAVDNENWDLLDKLLETDNSKINDKALYTDDWGEWWGLLMECVFKNRITGVIILLKHGAKKNVKTWGDCLPVSAVEAASKDSPEILKLLLDTAKPEYTRKTNPELPELSENDLKIIRQGEIMDKTGLVFNIE